MKPRLARKARVRADPRDGAAVLLSPERGLRLSETAAAVVGLCSGNLTLAGIVDALSARYPGADRARIERDVHAFLRDLYGRALVEDWTPGDCAPAVVEGPEASTVAPGPEGTEEGSSPGLDHAPAGAGDVPSGLDHAPAGAGDVPSPYTLVAELTHRCPLACPYCSNPRELVRGPDELRTDDWLRVLSEAKALGAMQLHLTGGEPLARQDLEAIAARARAADFYVNLVTSGIPADRGRLERLAPSLDHVQLSVQAPEAAVSDRVAGLESFEAKLRVAGWVKDLGLPLTINCVLHRENLDAIEATIALAERLGADRLELANVQMIAWAHTNANALLPTRTQIDRARRVAHEAKARLKGRMEVVFVLPDWHADRPRACMDGWGRRFVVVAPDGAVLPCHGARALPLAFGSVRDEPLARAWADAPGMKAFRGEDWMREPCRTCDRRGIDFGGCRCQAFALTGDARATDPACGLAPEHPLILAARQGAERSPERVWVYRGR